ncbi:NADPH-dependent 7-cyano-7-deazaguanine reductase QueF [candidate division WOR-3 bacterium]|nr:NADPH-dependent 7-cyano-7-deazaguanine reductase QueF [candidate division WOR-3 bacterium]
MAKYTTAHARAGLKHKLPGLEVLPNQFKGYTIVITIPEYTSLCPKTGLPDAGVIKIEYEPDRYFVELKSLKQYIHAYRDLGIFYENAVNRIAHDFMNAVKPCWVCVQGDFNPRGGITSLIKVILGTPPA